MASSQDPRQRRSKRTIGLWAAIAALVHLELALVVGLVAYFTAPRDAELKQRLDRDSLVAPESIDIGMLDDAAARKILADLDREVEKAKTEAVKKEVDSVHAPGQVIDLPKPREERRPDEARFAAEHDMSVPHETRHFGKFDEKARQGDARGEADESRPEVPSTAPVPPSALAMRTPGPQARVFQASPGLRGEKLAETEEGLLPQAGGSRAEARAGTTGGGAPAPVAALMPSQEQLARAIGSGTQDALKDIDEGDETSLNAKKWKFASFFNRVKKQVSDHWHPDNVYQRRDPTGAIYGHQDRLTILRVQLRPDGSLSNVAVEKPSGVEFLDDEAITAFKDAQPFPNPPKQLVEEGGVINFRFGFLLELNERPRMRLFRYNSM